MGFKLYIGNKNYSSWSFRPWIALTAADIPFEEVLVPFDDAGGNPKFREFSPTGKVPVLVDGDLHVWESLAIIAYAAETHPDRGLFPENIGHKAILRAVSLEMVSGFHALRGACPMNMRREKRKLDLPAEKAAAVARDVTRISEIWTSLIAQHGGPFLFGETFTAADAMYAPVVNRFDVYDLVDDPVVLRYMAHMKAQPAWIAWETAGRAEPWIVPADEA